MKRPLTDVQTIPFRGGCNTAVEPNLLASGAYSFLQNLRPVHPGFVNRPGCAKLHTVADGTNKVLSLYQFRKAKRDEYHLFAQMSDGDVQEAANNPPTVTTGAFGSDVFVGSASPIPASWSNINDKMLFCNGVDGQQIYPGNLSQDLKFIVVKDTVTIPFFPDVGADYSNEVTDGVSTTVAILDALDTLANNHAIFVMIPIQAKQLTWTVTAVNSSAAVMQGHYWKNTGAWTSMSITDNTIASAGKTLGQSGSMTWTPPADEIPRLMFGAYGFWYRFSLASGILSATVRVSEVSYEANWQNVQNIWDGITLDIIDFQYYVAASGVYDTFAASSISIGGATASDIFYFSTPDLIEGFYIDVGATPNTTASTTINAVLYWNGIAWTSVGTFVDNTAGLSKSGWVTFPRNAAKELQFAQTQYYAYWWKFTVDKTLSTSVSIGMQYMPYFDITELGKGYCNTVWKNRACYSFDRWGQYIYVTASDSPMILNGNDYGILEAGDGRANKITAMRQFHNELLVYQEEKGKEGGCVTLFEGYSPTTFGKLILSSKLGAMNNKCVAVVDGVMTSTATGEQIRTLSFALSRFGVHITDGLTCSFISEQIKNYFDPTKAECIRRGYEKEMWLEYDSAFNVIRIGLVSGSSATVPNVFLIFDLMDKTWAFDSLAQPLSCMTEVEAASGNITVLQVGGGTADGFIYQLNTGTQDVTTPIDAYAKMELDGHGEKFNLREMILRIKTQSAGNVVITPSKNGIDQTTITLLMTAENASEIIRRHRIGLDQTDHHLALKFDCAAAGAGFYLEDVGLKLEAYGEQ